MTVDDQFTDSDDDEPSLESLNGSENNDTDPEIITPILFNNIVEEFEKEIDTNFCVSKGELLLMALSAHQQNRWTNKTFVDVMNLFNFSLQNPILPSSQYLLDKYLFNEEAAGISKHFFCYVCSKDFGLLRNVTEVVCGNKNCKALNVATDPNKWRYFVSFDVLPQLQGLLNKTGVIEKLVEPRDVINQSNDNVIRDVYDGAMYKRFVNRFCLSSNIKYLSFTFNTDGAALYTSSNGSIWIVFLMINELPPVLRMQNLLTAQVWFGTDHPPMDLFLGPLVKQMDKLSHGFQLKIHKNTLDFQAYLIASCVDSGARGSVQGITTHSGFFSCNWCLIPGVYNSEKVVFPAMDPEADLRSHEQLFNDSVTAVSTSIPASLAAIEKATLTHGARSMCQFFHLESKSLDCVFGFVVDALHALDHGIARQCMKIWGDSEGDNYFISPAHELILDSYIDMLKPPVEVRKYPRKVSDRTNWTGREYANWVLLFSIPMLKDIVPRRQFESWCWFVQAIHILSRKEITPANIDTAEKLLKRFIVDFQHFYSLENMSFNCHLVSHACLTVRNWGPLWAISSAYAFEAGNGVVKKLLHSAHGVPNQVCRSLSHRICRSLLEDNFSTNQTKSYNMSIQPQKPMKRCTSVGSTHFLKTPLPFKPIPEEEYLCEQLNVCPFDCMIYCKVIKENMLIRSTCSRRSNNCVFETYDHKLVKFSKLIFDSKQRQGFGFCHELLCSRVIRPPHNIDRLAPKDECVRKVSSVSDELLLIPLDNVKMVCCFTELPQGTYVTVLPNLFNIN